MGKKNTFDKTSTNICKGIAIILMYIHHSFYSRDSWMGTDIIFSPFSEQWIMLISKVCKVCVSMFVFLSAYGVYRSQMKKESQGETYIQRYLPTVKRRYLSLLYNFVVVYILTQLLSGVLDVSRIEVYGESRLERLFYTIIDGLGLASAFRTPTYNATWWYMSLAFLLICILPIMIELVEKVGYALIPISLLLPLLCGADMKQVFWRYLFAVVLGLLCAKYNIFEIVYDMLYSNLLISVLGIGMLTCGIAVCGYCRQRLDYLYVIDAFFAAILCFWGYAVLQKLPFVNQIFAFLGKHSMNMFMIHTLVRSNAVRLHEFSYSPRYLVLIILLLIADTLVLSIAIEYFKKWIHVLIVKVKQNYNISWERNMP